MAVFRRELPIYKYKEQIVDLICANDVASSH